MVEQQEGRMAKQAERDRSRAPVTREPDYDNRYVADWHRKSRKDIVRDAVSELGMALKDTVGQKSAPEN